MHFMELALLKKNHRPNYNFHLIFSSSILSVIDGSDSHALCLFEAKLLFIGSKIKSYPFSRKNEWTVGPMETCMNKQVKTAYLSNYSIHYSKYVY